MNAQSHFKDWWNVIPHKELYEVLGSLSKMSASSVSPLPVDIFRAFAETSHKDCKVVFIGQDPYPQRGVATGLCFANHKDVRSISPSLDVLMECCINPELPHGHIDFDVTLESWAEQGVLLLNSALTCEINRIGSHVMMWRPFISKFLYKLSRHTPGIIYVLFGKQAQTLKPYINKYDDTLEVEHPSFFARSHTKMPYSLFNNIDRLTKEKYGIKINWYNEY